MAKQDVNLPYYATAEQRLTEAVNQIALTGVNLENMISMLREGYSKGRREYLDLNPDVRAAIMSAPEQKEDELCPECGTDLNDGDSYIKTLRQ